MGVFTRKNDENIQEYFPDEYFNKITDIDINTLKEKGIKGVIIDIDNTVIDKKRRVRSRIKLFL